MSKRFMDELAGATDRVVEEALRESDSIDAKLEWAQRKFEFYQRERRIKLVATLTALLFLLSGMAVSFYQSFIIGGPSEQIARILGVGVEAPAVDAGEIDAIKNSVRQANDSFAKMLQDFVKNNDSESLVALDIASLRGALESMNKRLEVLERSISDSPEKALSIPLLRKDQENMSKTIDANRLAVGAELTRLYEQQKWILGGIGTVLLAAITGLLSVLYKLVFREAVPEPVGTTKSSG